MERAAYLACLASDHRRLREVAATAPAATVPTCPEWTMTDLVSHVAHVYLHKTLMMSTGGTPKEWPPDPRDEDPFDMLDRTYADLVAELTERDPSAPTPTWYDADQTVGFWLRRMAHESLIHRIDAELAAGAGIAPIRTDLALDGIDEVLVCFLAESTPDEYGDLLAATDGRSVSVHAGQARWSVRMTPAGVDVSPGGEFDAKVSGAPDQLLLWLWRRAGDEAVQRDGDLRLVDTLRGLLGAATL